jgi:ribosomal protein S18 acetylase RimI-like enzyme
VIAYRSLIDTPIEHIHKAFLLGFSDYFVPMQVSLDDFKTMHAIRGVDYSLSIGAFDGDDLVGFTTNGIGIWRGLPTAYDAATAVAQKYRGRGISREMFRVMEQTLVAEGYRRYLLEVITTNAPAIALYERLGFKTMRTLSCLRVSSEALLTHARDAFDVREAPVSEWQTLRSALESDSSRSFLPAWQNSWDAVQRYPDKFRVIAVRDDHQLLGYGVFSFGKGSIHQVWVAPRHRRRGVGRAILRRIAEAAAPTPTLVWANVDASSTETMAFLATFGFEEFVAQYEMEREL